MSSCTCRSNCLCPALVKALTMLKVILKSAGFMRRSVGVWMVFMMLTDLY